MPERTGRTGEPHERAAAEAARREEDSAAEPEPVEARPAAGMRFPDPPDVLAVRADRILGRGGPSPSAVVADIHREAMNLPDADERIIDLPHELQAWSFCPAGSGPGPRSPGSSSGREPHKRDVHLRIPKAAGETAAS
ncbi:hypothetical protein [Streptomyces sp. NPDC092370]|uniref:hypothetical protein n=1 Tax=Streptomyces sp. NPDC092370 TaxID=3366016 RepID=UPI00382F6CEC